MNSIPGDAYLLIIGAMKSGTTSLYEYIAQHPEICECRVKEPEFFSRRQEHGTGVRSYEDLWDFDENQHKYALEASTGYTKYPAEIGVPKRMSKLGIDPLFIYIVRDPFDRIESHFNAARTNPSWDYSITDEHLVSVSNYHLQLSRFREHFPRERFLVLDFDALKTDPRRVLTEVYDFTGLSHDHYPEDFLRMNVTPSLSRLELIHRRSSFLQRIGNWLPKGFRRSVKSLVSSSGPLSRIRLSDEQRGVVKSKLEGSMRKFQEEYGIDVEKWGF